MNICSMRDKKRSSFISKYSNLLSQSYECCVLYFGEQLFTAVCGAKQAHWFLHLDNKFGESSRWKHVVLIETEDVASKKLEHWKSMTSVCNYNGTSLQSTWKDRKFWKLDIELHRWALRITGWRPLIYMDGYTLIRTI